MDLEETSNDASQAAREVQIEGAEVQQQQAKSRERLAEAKRYQRILEGAIRANDEQYAQTRSAGQQAFEDRYNFLGNDWDDHRDRAARGVPPDAGRKVDLERLVEGAPLQGLSVSRQGRPRETKIDNARARAVKGGGLAPLGGRATRTISPALETPPAPHGEGRLSFRANDGSVDLELRIQRDGVAPRFGSLLAILGILALVGWRAWAKRR